MNRERLLHLLDTMQHLADDKLDMQIWFSKQPHCGTVACAGGWEAQTPYAQQHGLHLVMDDDGEDGTPTYQRKIGMGALIAYFDLTPDLARWLFSALAYEYEGKPIEVAERIISVLASEIDTP